MVLKQLKFEKELRFEELKFEKELRFEELKFVLARARIIDSQTVLNQNMPPFENTNSDALSKYSSRKTENRILTFWRNARIFYIFSF